LVANELMIDAIIVSHWHWDHIGDPSKFPAKTDLVVGTGFKESFCPGWPKDPEGLILSSDTEYVYVSPSSFPWFYGT
jgi:glyoxylase-like metal-dependent hydrolase (beta-lactamase superfamily II)